jgi:hypothetical protein
MPCPSHRPTLYTWDILILNSSYDEGLHFILLCFWDSVHRLVFRTDHDVSTYWSVSVLRWKSILDWVHYRDLSWATEPPVVDPTKLAHAPALLLRMGTDPASGTLRYDGQSNRTPRRNSPRYPLHRRLGGPKSRSGRREEDILTLPELKLRSLGRQPVASRYTSWAIPAAPLYSSVSNLDKSPFISSRAAACRINLTKM